MGGKQLPLARYPFERAASAVFENDARAGCQVANGAGDQDLARSGLLANARADDRGDAAYLSGDHLALPGVHPRPNFQAKSAEPVAHCHRAAHRAPRRIERGEEAITGGVDLDAAVAVQLAPHRGVVLLDELAPPSVAKLGGARGAVDDIGEQNGREESVGLRPRSDSREKLLDRVD